MKLLMFCEVCVILDNLIQVFLFKEKCLKFLFKIVGILNTFEGIREIVPPVWANTTERLGCKSFQFCPWLN